MGLRIFLSGLKSTEKSQGILLQKISCQWLRDCRIVHLAIESSESSMNSCLLEFPCQGQCLLLCPDSVKSSCLRCNSFLLKAQDLSLPKREYFLCCSPSLFDYPVLT